MYYRNAHPPFIHFILLGRTTKDHRALRGVNFCHDIRINWLAAGGDLWVTEEWISVMTEWLCFRHWFTEWQMSESHLIHSNFINFSNSCFLNDRGPNFGCDQNIHRFKYQLAEQQRRRVSVVTEWFTDLEKSESLLSQMIHRFRYCLCPKDSLVHWIILVIAYIFIIYCQLRWWTYGISDVLLQLNHFQCFM